MTTTAIWPILACLVASFITCLLIILTQRWHGKLSLDHDLNGVQKIHETPVPRVGGIGVVIGLVLAGLFSYQLGGETYETAGKLLLCAIPVFSAGLIEDFTKSVGVRTRLFAAFISAGLAFFALDAQLNKLDTPGLDYLIGFGVVSFAFTCFAVGGLTNAINIIDGLNGLASGSVAIMLTGLGLLALHSGDTLVFKLCMWGTAAAIGFLVVNYPFGKIFLGDGGAYLAGFWLAECAVLLMARNPEINTWTVLLCVSYPVVETVYSMFRRHVITKAPSGAPDSGHMHQLLYRRLHHEGRGKTNSSWFRHGVASAIIWGMTGACQFLAVIASDKTPYLFIATLLFIFIYCWIYQSLSPTSPHKQQAPVHAAEI
ncbi:MAG TPA: glycosyltransferase [Polaromonas sp.]|nr:glycosyltransferase [Polaromonas sp.]